MTAELFHGTRKPFKKGGLVLPGDDVGIDNHALGRSSVVYVTPDFDLACDYAEQAVGSGTPRVVSVFPLGDLYPDRSTVGGVYVDSWCCDAAVVRSVVYASVEAQK